MKYPYYDPETNKEYDCEMNMSSGLNHLQKKHDYNFGMMSVTEYAMIMINEIIKGLRE